MANQFTDSILASVKQSMPNSGVPEDYTVFDQEIIMDINMALAQLSQIGVGEVNTVFQISGSGETWGDYIDDPELLSLIPPYVAIVVRSLFDPSKSSIIKDTLNEQLKQLEFRINDVCRRIEKRKEETE
jgi:dihydropteroate synthase